MTIITLNDNEVDVLLQLIDVAVKSLGLNGAKSAVVMADKISLAFQQSKEVKPVENKEEAKTE